MEWEQQYQTGSFPWDRGEASPGLVDYLRDNEAHGRILIPGCGRGHDVRAWLGANRQPVGLDISPTAVALARALDPEAPAERYVEGDLFALPAAWANTFDWVWEHTCFCAINPADRPRYVDAVAEVLQPGGTLLGIFYLRPHEEDDPSKGPPFQCEVAELDGLFRDAFVLVRSWSPARAFESRAGRELMREYVRR